MPFQNGPHPFEVTSHHSSQPFGIESLRERVGFGKICEDDRHGLSYPHHPSSPDWVRAWKPAVPGIHEVLHARFVDHAYPPHTHDAWTVFIVDNGAIRYNIDRRDRGAAGARVTILPPHLVHDGRPAHRSGYRKRVIYLSTAVLDERLIGPAQDHPDIGDPRVVRGIHALHKTLVDPGETLAAESTLAIVTARLLEELGGRSDEAVERSDDGLAPDLRDLLDERRFQGITLAEAGRILHASPAHLVRCFSRTFGIAPHRYLVARRIEAARWRLLEGEPVAQVAAGVGFYDQAHLTRHFKRHVGTTPAHYASRRRVSNMKGGREHNSVLGNWAVGELRPVSLQPSGRRLANRPTPIRVKLKAAMNP